MREIAIVMGLEPGAVGVQATEERFSGMERMPSFFLYDALDEYADMVAF